MKRKFMFLALAAIGLASCNAGFKSGESGMLYKINVDKDGPTLKEGDFLSINFVEKTDGDSVLQSSYVNGRPTLLILPKSRSKGDIFSAFKFLSEGDSATVKINIDSTLSKGQPRPPFKGKYVVFYLKVEKVVAKGNLSDEVFKGRIDAYVKSQADEMRKQEPVKIKKYIDDNNLKVTTTPSGLSYVITSESNGPKPVVGDTVAVYYVGKFLSGKVFDTNIKDEAVKAKLQINPMNPYKPLKFALGVQGMIQGWNEAFPLIGKGSKATLILPSNLAYGEQGNQQIPGFSSMVFNVELVDIIHPNPNAPKPPVVGAQVQTQQPVKKTK